MDIFARGIGNVVVDDAQDATTGLWVFRGEKDGGGG